MNYYGLEEDEDVAKAKASYEQSRKTSRAKGKTQQERTQQVHGYSSNPNRKSVVDPNPNRESAVDHIFDRQYSPERVSSATIVPASTPLNMQLQNSMLAQRMMVKDCVKTTLFRRVKFFIKDLHGLYDVRNGSVCALIIANCNVLIADADDYWWAGMRKLIVSTHTDRRNNVIKNIRLRFNGTLACCKLVDVTLIMLTMCYATFCGRWHVWQNCPFPHE